MKFILFAHPRSGSTSLSRLLNLHPELNVAIEPFHPDYPKWNPGQRCYVESIIDRHTLESVLSEIYMKYNGIKVLDYQLPEDIYSYMLLLPQHKVIMLMRRNILQSIVSGLIAEQTDVWQISDMNSERKKKYENLKPLSLDDIAERIKNQSDLRKFYTGIIRKKNKDSYFILEYEDLYTEEMEKNINTLSNIFAFLGLKIPETDKINTFLNPGIAKINNSDTYQCLLPNAKEINDMLGNDKTGWLFE